MRTFCLAVSGVLLAAAAALAAPEVVSLETQRVGEVTYFHVRLQTPPDLELPALNWWDRVADTPTARQAWLRLPRLVPQDDRTAAVCYEVFRPGAPRKPGHLDFLGRLPGKGKASLRLVYPTGKPADRPDRGLFLAPPPLAWREEAVTLDFRKAQEVAPPNRPRFRDRSPADEDLEGRWAIARAREFAIAELQTPEMGFFGLAREATCRKYDVRMTPLELDQAAPVRELEHRRLYELATGATALTESLALRRLLSPGFGPEEREKRTIDIAKVPGIDIAEHPWERMMAGKKPEPEPLAGLTPHDNYYVTFRGVPALVRFAGLMDEWGGNLLSAWEPAGRDYQLRRRYERQLCLNSAELARTLGPDLLKGVAITGSDFYLREGSDVSVLFHVNDTKALRKLLKPFLSAAKREHGDRLRYRKEKVRGVTVESWVTPGREVSLHRAAFDDFVVCSNSAVALERILDVRAGRRKALAESLDFQYMRTVFVRSEKGEDGFAFFSDAFIRSLVGPASKIKEKRRLEALASLRLVTHGALFAALETGALPRDHRDLLRESRLKPEEVYAPEGESLAWDGGRQEAVSDVYGTLRFGTPLIELPLDRVTRREAEDYRAFREEYMQQWRRFFDPVGMRVSLGPKEVRLETYILPLIQNTRYNELRVWTDGGTTRLDLSALTAPTLFQYLAHLAPEQRQLPVGTNRQAALGDWLLVRLDDSPLYAKLAGLWVRRELGLLSQEDWQRQGGRLVVQLPLTVGVKVGDQKAFDAVLTGLEQVTDVWLGGSDKETFKYKGVPVRWLRLRPENKLTQELNDPRTPEEQLVRPQLFHAQLDGAWYGSFSREALQGLIDRALGRREGQGPDRTEGPEVNSSVYLAPGSAVTAQKAVQAYLEWEVHRRAAANGPLWEALYRSGVLSAKAKPATVRETALRTFGYVPVSPEGAAYRYDRGSGEVVNERHGSLTRPTLHPRLAADAPLARLLRQIQTLRADLRFREDGVHTTLTIRLEP
jgi:hypothetical protein